MRVSTLVFSALLALAGCTRNTVIVVAPPAVPRPTVNPACALPATAPRIAHTGPALIVRNPETPPAAVQAKVAGCAGVLYRLTADGEPYDLQVITESPQGYGYGDAALIAVGGTRYHHQVDTNTWHYNTYSTNFTAAPPAQQRVPVYRPAPTSSPYNL